MYRKLWIGLVALAAIAPLSLAGNGVVQSVHAQMNDIPPANAACQPHGQARLIGQMYPTQIEPTGPIWCYTQPSPQLPTRVLGANDWVDTFDNDGPSITQFNDGAMGYRVFDNFVARSDRFKAGYFVNVNHWMIDLVDVSSDRLSGGVLVSPDQQFFFEDGKLVVEVDAAAGSDGMGGANRFYEIDLSPAPAPTGVTVDALYGYGAFGGVGAVGCRLERNDQGGNFVCSMYDDSGRATDGRCVGPQPCTGPDRPGRVWETQGVGTRRTAAAVTGGYPEWPIPGTGLRLRDVWRMCAANELDLHCRDRFRLEVTKDSLHLFVNGYLYMAIDGLYAQNPEGRDSRIPDSWFQRGVRAYFTSWVNGGQHAPIRWHWDRVAVNPKDASGNPAPPSAAPSFCLGQPNNTCPGGPLPTAQPTTQPAPSRTPGGAPSATPVRTATAVPPTSTPPLGTSDQQTVTFDDLSGQNQPLSGQYPGGLIDWGTNAWYHSGPWGAFATNSVGFNGAGPTSASFAFITPRRLVSARAYNGGGGTSTVSISCPGQPTATAAVAAGQVATIGTGWTGACSPVTISSTNGWDTNFDDFVVSSGSGTVSQTPTTAPTTAPTRTPTPSATPTRTAVPTSTTAAATPTLAAATTVTFDDLSGQNRVLSGQYPTGVIDWGANAWYLSGPWGAFTTKSVGFNGAGPTSASFAFVTPRRLVSVRAYNGGSAATTVTLSCAGQPTVTTALAAGQVATISTGWTGTCTAVTVGSTNGWDTNFDDLVISG